jgi:hypothetical protein
MRTADEASLLIPREVTKHLSKSESLRLPPVRDCFHNVGRQAGERQQPADVGVRDTSCSAKSVILTTGLSRHEGAK